jgi:YesN/AraC family two-component response regulator
MNFPNYLNHLRIREVQRMLGHEKHKTMTLEGIASSVGFHSKPTFNAAFKKITGVTPSIYIKNMEDIHREEPAVTFQAS